MRLLWRRIFGGIASELATAPATEELNSKFNAADKVRAEGACTLCRAEAVKSRPCGGLKFKI